MTAEVHGVWLDYLEGPVGVISARLFYDVVGDLRH